MKKTDWFGDITPTVHSESDISAMEEQYVKYWTKMYAQSKGYSYVCPSCNGHTIYNIEDICDDCMEKRINK